MNMLKNIILVHGLVALLYACADIGDRDNPFDSQGTQYRGCEQDWSVSGNDGDVVFDSCTHYYRVYDEVEAAWLWEYNYGRLDSLGVCTTKRTGKMQWRVEKKGQITIDTSYYMCAKNHEWVMIYDAVIKNIMGYDCDSDGNLVLGQIDNESYFVCDKGVWRVATAADVEIGGACTVKRQGRLTMDSTLICDNENFRIANVYDFEVGAKNNFNPDIEYGNLDDERDGRSYKTVVINGITVMAENLNYADKNEYDSLAENSWCYNNDSLNCLKGGRYYNWYAAMNIDLSWQGNIKYPHQGICPKGWHIPTNEEWIALFNNVPYTAQASASNIGWLNATNESGFSALPLTVYFSGTSYEGYAEFWSATESGYNRAYVWYIVDYVTQGKAGLDNYFEKNTGFPVRCFKD